MATNAPGAYLLPYLRVTIYVITTNLMTFKGLFALAIKYPERGM
jgi:hypothetical protein